MAEEIQNENIPTEESANMMNVASKRVHFKVHLTIFIVINAIIWALWFTLFSAIVTSEAISSAILKVFICVTVVWFLLVILHYYIAFKWNKTFVENELNKIRKQRKKQLQEIEKIKAKIAETKAQHQTEQAQ